MCCVLYLPQEMEEFLWLQRLDQYREEYENEESFQRQVGGGWGCTQGVAGSVEVILGCCVGRLRRIGFLRRMRCVYMTSTCLWTKMGMAC